jgi:hypothetical protein
MHILYLYILSYQTCLYNILSYEIADKTFQMRDT